MKTVTASAWKFSVSKTKTDVHCLDRKMVTRRQFLRAGFENNKLTKRLYREVGKAIGDFNLVEENDKVMVCISGGKDSFALLDILVVLQSRAPIHFDIVAVNLDQQLPGFPTDILPAYLEKKQVPYHIEVQDTYSIIQRLIPEGKAVCSLCSRLRRGILYKVASELGATKIALGHHRDDVLETFFLNLFFGSKLKSMPPKLKSKDGKHIVIRPLINVKETDLEKFAEMQQYPVFPKNLCGAKENVQRQHIKTMLREWGKRYPGRIENIFSSLSTVVPAHLMDTNLFDFNQLGTESSDEDEAF